MQTCGTPHLMSFLVEEVLDRKLFPQLGDSQLWGFRMGEIDLMSRP